MSEAETVSEQPVEDPIRKLVTVQRVVDLQPIEGKDRIELAKILGYRAVVERGSVKIGQLIAYHETDSFVPVEDPAYAFLEKDAKDDGTGKQRARIRTRKFGDAYSQGLVVTLDKLALASHVDTSEGADLSAVLNVIKYDPDARKTSAPGQRFAQARPAGQKLWPGDLLMGIEKTDEERLQSNPRLLAAMRGSAVYVAIKCDGSSLTAAKDLDGTEIVCSRNFRLVPVEGEPLDAFNAAARECGIFERLRPGYAIQGELCGPGIQRNKMGLQQRRVFVFNVFRRLVEGDAWEELPFREARGFCTDVGLEFVPIVQRGWLLDDRHTVDEMVQLSQQEYPNGYPAEGIVIRPEEPKRDRNGRRVSAKVINPQFEIKG